MVSVAWMTLGFLAIRVLSGLHWEDGDSKTPTLVKTSDSESGEGQ